LESFTLFAAGSLAARQSAAARVRADIGETILRLAGLYELGSEIPRRMDEVEVDEFVTIDLRSRYAPYRDGKVQGEERSAIADALAKADTGPVEFGGEVKFIGAVPWPRRLRLADSPSGDRGPVQIEPRGDGYQLVIGPLGEVPVIVEVNAVAEDRFGLRSPVTVLASNVRITEAQAWTEWATGTSLADLRRQLERLEADARSAPTNSVRAAAAMLRALVEAMAALGHTAPAATAAGVMRLHAEVAQHVRLLAKSAE
jgi:hypothetical protein